MKNNALKLLSLALVLPMMTACPKPNKNTATWSEEVSAAMTLYAGEVLPYLNFDEGTLTYGYNDYYSIFYVYDDNEVDVTEGYADKLIAAGFEAVENDDGEGGTYVTYNKINDLGFISVDFGWMEADEDYPAGNFLNVSVPAYVDEDILAEQGYSKQAGFPTDLVEFTLEGSGITLSPLNANGEWWVADELYEDEDEGSYYCAYLATQGNYFDAIYDDLTGQGLAYYESMGCFYDELFNTDAMIYVSIVRDFTIIDIYGQTLEPEKPDVASEKQNEDGSITVTYTFANALVEGTSYEETFESESCNLTVGKGGNTNNAPTYYTSGASLRCYYKNTLVLEAAQGYEIQSVNLTVGFVKNLTINDVSASAGTVSASGTVPGATVAVSGVNAGSLTITVGANATKGNVGFSAIEVVVAPVR